MIDFVTINTIVQDVLLTVRGGILTQSEPISKRQIEGLTHRGRAVLLKRDIDKGKNIDPQYVQQLDGLEVEEVDKSDSSISTEYKTFRTKVQLPSLITLNTGPAVTYVGTINGQEIQFVSEGRVIWQKYKKYTNNDPLCYLRDGYLYVENDKEIRYISLRGVFQVPTEVSRVVNPNDLITDTTGDSPYPIPISLLPALKEMILKELLIEVRSFSDTDNDSASDLEPNLTGEVRHSNRLNSSR